MLELSVIVPIYNTPEKALLKCFESIKEIKNVSMEVILIDDGSEKSTSDFCQSFANDNKDIFKYYHQENAGVSVARNAGMDLAKGRYLCFVDSDDVLVADVVRKAVLLSDYDIIIYDMERMENKKNIARNAFENIGTSEVSCRDAFYRAVYSTALNSSYCKLIKLDFAKRTNSRFITGMITAEDLAFVLSLLRGKPRVYYLKEVGYIYQRQQSNADLRIINHPIQTLEDGYNVCELKRNIACEFELTDVDKLTSFMDRRRVRGIFRWACVLMSAKQLDDEKKALAKKHAEMCSKSMKGASFLESLSFHLIVKERWQLIRILASIRSLYISLNLHVLIRM